MKRRSPATLCLLFSCLGSVALSPPVPAAAVSPNTVPLTAAGQKLADGDAAGAVKVLQAALQANPGNADALHLLTIAYLHTGQDQQAAATAAAILEQPTLDPKARSANTLLLGQARYSAFVDRYKHYSSNSLSLPNMRQLLSQMATHRYETPRNEVIIEQGDVTAQDDYNDEETRMKGQIAQMETLLKQAEEAFQKALDADPNLAGLHDGLGLIRNAEGYPGEARGEFERELSMHGPNGMVYTHLGELDVQENHPSEALANFRRAVVFSPHLAMPYDDLAGLYAKQHDNERAQWAAGMALLVRGDATAAGKLIAWASPKSEEMLCAQAEYALTQKRQDDARSLMERARALDPKNAQIISALGDIEEAQGKTEQALATYHEAIAVDTACDAAWYGIGLVYDARNDKESAIADYKQALIVNPNNPLAKLNLAADEADLGRSSEAATELRDYLQRFPTASNCYAVQTTLADLASS